MVLNLKTGEEAILRILVVAADPTASSNEHLEQEADVIREALGERKNLRPEFHFANTLVRKDFFETSERFKPDVIDITSHGSPSQKILMEDKGGWIRNISGSALVQGLKAAVGRIDCLFFNNCNVSRNFGALSQIARTTVRFLHSYGAIDVSPLVAKGFFKSLAEKLDFDDAFDEFSSLIEHEDSFREIKANLLLEKTHVRSDGTLVREAELSQLIPRIENENITAGASSPPRHDTEGPRIYRVWYGTNRRPVSADSAGITYGSERDSVVHLGYCDVAIPKYHTIGSVGGPWWQRFPRFWRNNRLSVQQRICLDESRYWQDLGSFFANLEENDQVLLLFVHGYNVTFDQAALRAAQFGFDLSVRGATAFFSWPSKGRLSGYAADVAALEASEQELGRFIVEMVDRNKVKKAHLIAHSMGNKGLLRAFSSIVQRLSVSLSISLQQIFLAAPDVDVDLFRRLASIYPEISVRTTMYVSDKDKALLSSGIIHDYPRAGYVPPVTVVDGVDTIHVSAIDLSFLGHGYIAEARPVLQDMHQLMESDTPPDRRFGLERVTVSPTYWRIRG